MERHMGNGAISPKGPIAEVALPVARIAGSVGTGGEGGRYREEMWCLWRGEVWSSWAVFLVNT